ncbi:MAG TPA: DUF58 domain-containing protein, partial [Chloroflexia bacterium]|nr:DUF58 domain-containing protein [Chloroflexia bacterium]
MKRRLPPWLPGRAGAAAPPEPERVVDAGLLQKLDRLALAPGPAVLHGLIGAHPARRRTAGIEFADYRPYTPGDDLRRVDWNAYARLGSLQIRQAPAEHETVLGLLVDASASMACGRPPKLLLARRLAAALGYIALAHLDGVLLAAPGTPLSTADLLRGQPGTLTLFAALEGLAPGATAPFDEVLRAWSGRLGPGRG